MIEYSAEIWQGGMKVAACFGTDMDQVNREAMHYATVYGQDGEVEVICSHHEAALGQSGPKKS